MITWMQRHKKYLIITIWISTIAFVGAGFVGWGQYSYGDKSGAIAKVGNVAISQGDLQKAYSNLYTQYSKIFQGNFDEEKAKNFGLKRQALKQLIDQALILNLAQSYDLSISDKELLQEITSQNYFFENGTFSKELYKRVLSQNRLSTKEYESDVRKELLIKKVIALLPIVENEDEKTIMDTVLSIADKIKYKVLDSSSVTIDKSNKKLQKFWETRKNEFMTDVAYKVAYIKQEKITKKYNDAKITTFYKENKTHFKGSDGKILKLKDAKEKVIAELNNKATKEQALRTYIAMKKEKLDAMTKLKEAVISNKNNIFDAETLQKISQLSMTSPYMKPVKVGNNYYIIKLESILPSKVKTFKQAKAELLPLYTKQAQKDAILKLANNSLKTFKGKISKFVTLKDADKLTLLTTEEANNFLSKVFESDKKRSFITLDNDKIVLYDILEQKLLKTDNSDRNNSILRIKSAMFNEGLIKTLQKKYNTEIFIEGL